MIKDKAETQRKEECRRCHPRKWPIEPDVASTPRRHRSRDIGFRHSALVRVTHWVITLSFFALVLSGGEIVVSHPRFYWGETGNVLTKPLFKIANSCFAKSRSHRLRICVAGSERMEPGLHFQSAWALVGMACFM